MMICDDLDKNRTNDTIIPKECQALQTLYIGIYFSTLKCRTDSDEKKPTFTPWPTWWQPPFEFMNTAVPCRPPHKISAPSFPFPWKKQNRLCHKLNDLQIIETLQKPGGARLFIKDHLKIEDIPDQPDNINLQSELEQFKRAREEQMAKIKSIQTEHAEKKKKAS